MWKQQLSAKDNNKVSLRQTLVQLEMENSTKVAELMHLLHLSDIDKTGHPSSLLDLDNTSANTVSSRGVNQGQTDRHAAGQSLLEDGGRFEADTVDIKI